MPRHVKHGIYTLYHGEWLSRARLAERVGMGEETLAKWARKGKLNESAIDAHLRERVRYRSARDAAARNGVGQTTFRMRIYRGATPEEAALPPEQYKRTEREDYGNYATL